MYLSFPKDFLFGAASSAVQIEAGCDEGGKGKDAWQYYTDRFPGGGSDTGAAADFYHKYLEDIKLMKELGLKTFRFSISWSRIYPNGPEEVCKAGLDYYSDVIDKLIEADIVPFFDLWHCDLPAWVIDRGGVLNPDFSTWFTAYAETCFKEFGTRVPYWSTVNEPNINVLAGYAWESCPPYERDMDKAIKACHKMILAHYDVVRLYKKMNLGGKIGFTIHLYPSYGFTLDKKDIDAAERFTSLYSGIFTDAMLLGHYPECLMDYPYFADKLPEGYQKELDDNFIPSDYLGINYYGTTMHEYFENDQFCYRNAAAKLPKDDYGFTVNNAGLFDTVMYAWEKYPDVEFMITENGISKKKWGNYEEELEDDYRISYIRENLRSLARVLKTGAPVTGYYHWSILDTNEGYVSGYDLMFGLVQVRFDTLERVPRKSFYYYKQIIEEGKVN
ncbi:MAG: family 1 glycosylhydrolase [Oscillospiraceae bacterium]|nr:family 1 glycosylhydrolase [Oscillospiraceae bacterium]